MKKAAVLALVIGLCLFEDIDAARNRLSVGLRASSDPEPSILAGMIKDKLSGMSQEELSGISNGELSKTLDAVEALQDKTDDQSTQLDAEVIKAFNDEFGSPLKEAQSMFDKLVATITAQEQSRAAAQQALASNLGRL